MNKILKQRIINLHSDEDKICALCIDEELLIDKDNGFATTCGHIFHDACINDHFSIMGYICPLCKEPQKPFIHNHIINIRAHTEIRNSMLNQDMIQYVNTFDTNITLADYTNISYNSNALITAIDLNNVYVFRYLLNNCIISNITLHNAFIKIVEMNNHMMFETMLEKMMKTMDLDVTYLDNKAFRLAVMNGNMNMIEILVEYDNTRSEIFSDTVSEIEIDSIDMSAMNNEALRLATQNGHLEIFQYIEETISIDDDIASVLYIIAIRYGHIDILSHIQENIQYEFDLDNMDTQDALVNAIKQNKVSTIDAIINIDMDLDDLTFIDTLLLTAIIYNRLRIVDLLLESYELEEFIYHDMRFIQAAIETAQLIIVKRLFANGANFSDSSLIIFAIEYKREKIAEYIIDYIDEYSNDVLKKAVSIKNKKIINVMLNSYLQYFIEDDDANCYLAYVLEIAVKYRHYNAIKLLAAYGADLGVNTDLVWYAVHNKCISMIKLLLQNAAIVPVYKQKMRNIHIRKYVNNITIHNAMQFLHHYDF